MGSRHFSKRCNCTLDLMEKNRFQTAPLRAPGDAFGRPTSRRFVLAAVLAVTHEAVGSGCADAYTCNFLIF